MAEDVLYVCGTKKCSFATKLAYNYCPHCGSLMYVHKQGDLVDTVINITAPDSKCEKAFDCARLGYYSEACEDRVEQNYAVPCVHALWDKIDSLDTHLRMLRSALEEQGVKVSQPRPPRQ